MKSSWFRAPAMVVLAFGMVVAVGLVPADRGAEVLRALAPTLIIGCVLLALVVGWLLGRLYEDAKAESLGGPDADAGRPHEHVKLAFDVTRPEDVPDQLEVRHGRLVTKHHGVAPRWDALPDGMPVNVVPHDDLVRLLERRRPPLSELELRR